MRYFDLHCDTIYKCMEENTSMHSNSGAISFEKGNKTFERWAQCFAIWMPDTYRGEQAVEFYERSLAFFKNNAKECVKVNNFNDFYFDDKNAKCNAVLTVEGGSALAGDLDRIETLKNDGVKLVTLTWNGDNELGCGAKGSGGGLTQKGKDAVTLMNRAGIIVDVSHLNDAGFYDVARRAERPFVATHSNSHAVCNNPRNITDEQFKIIRDCGGVVGINFYVDFISGEGAQAPERMFEHIAHFLELGGENTVCMGSDFDGAEVPEYIKDITFIPMLRDKLEDYGLDKRTLDKIFYENSMNFFEKNLTY